MADDKAAVPGGLYKNQQGVWVDANGKPVNVAALAPELQKAIGYKAPAEKVSAKPAKKAPAKKKAE